MTIWAGETRELEKLYESLKGQLPIVVKELEQLIKTEDANVVMLYSRRCLEVIITDLCECELNRPRKTEPLKGIIDKLNSEEKVPSHIISSMHSLNSMSTFGTHPKDFDPEQVKPVLINLTIIIRWYHKYKDTPIVKKTSLKEGTPDSKVHDDAKINQHKPKYKLIRFLTVILIVIVIVSLIVLKYIIGGGNKNRVDDIDGNTYKTANIGTQVWMAENLKTTKFNDGSLIPYIEDSITWTKFTEPACCFYNGDIKNKAIYGILYNSYAVNTGKLCPSGWHMPSDNEWTALTTYLGGEDVAGGKLKEEGTIRWQNPNAYANNDKGFSALPGGMRYSDGSFIFIGQGGYWWSSMDYRQGNYWVRSVGFNSSDLNKIGSNGTFGFSVRCVKN